MAQGWMGMSDALGQFSGPRIRPWIVRSPAIASMLNPGIVALILVAASEEYERACKKAMPWELIYLVVPLVLHRGTREALPQSTRSHLAKWVMDNPVLQAGFPERARSLAPHVAEGFRFALQNELVILTPEGNLSGSIPSGQKPSSQGDLVSIVRASGLLGRWFAKSERTSTLFALLGVRP